MNSKTVKLNDCLMIDSKEYIVLGFQPSDYSKVSEVYVAKQTVVEIITVDTLKEPLLSNLQKLLPQL